MNLYLNNLYNQLPAIFVVLPMLASTIILIIANSNFAKLSFIFINFILVILALVCYPSSENIVYYNFGDWSKNIGIEFKLDPLSYNANLLLYLICSLYGIFCFTSFRKQLENLLIPGRKHIPYALFLLVEAGYSGIILTNDIFNLYVFIELASLATYPLIAISNNKKSYIAAFEYLIIGTIAATMILLAIGLILALTGSLNLSNVKIYFSENFHSTKYICAIFLIGALIKIAAFPLHSWKVKSYNTTSNLIFAFFINTSSFVALILLLKFRFLINLMSYEANNIIVLFGMASILFGNISGFREDDYRKIIIYSSISSIGYYFVLWPYSLEQNMTLLVQLILLDTMTKMGLILFAIGIGKEEFSIRQLIGFAKYHKYLAAIFVVLLLNAAAMPPSIAFFNKLSIISYYADSKQFAYVAIIAIASLLSVLYYIRIARQLVKTSEIHSSFELNKMALTGVGFLVIALLAIIFITPKISQLSHLIFIKV